MIKNTNAYRKYKSTLARIIAWGDAQLDGYLIFSPEEKEKIKSWGSKNRKV